MKIGLERIAPGFLRWHRHAIVAGAALVGLVVLAGGLGRGLDAQLKIARDDIRSHAASGQVEIVEIDEKSVAAIDKWPWPRSVHAAIVDRLHAAGARSIAFDVDFSSASTPAEGGKLAEALTRANGSGSPPPPRPYPNARGHPPFL